MGGDIGMRAAAVEDGYQLATGRVREAADKATVQVRDSGALEKAQDAREQVRRNPLPVGAVVAAAVLVVGLILVMRGRRR